MHPDTPLGWVTHLTQKLDRRARDISVYDDYYAGRHAMTFTTSDFRAAFGRMLDGYADNWCRIVIDAAVERLTPQGFRFPSGDDEDGVKADAEAWAIWKANRLDAEMQIGFVEAMVSGVAYGMVWFPDGTFVDEDGRVNLGDGPPKITIEHPYEVIVEHAAGDRRKRLAGVKCWRDGGVRRATLYLPDTIHKFEEIEKTVGGAKQLQWEELPDEGGVNPLGMVPIVALTNRPRLQYQDGESELVEIIPNQDAINKLAKDMLVASEYAAFPQRYATGVEEPVDPETNEPLQDWKPDVSRFMTTANENAKLGSLDAADLRNFVVALDNRVNSLASQSRTPPHYLNASADRLSGESMKAAEAGLVARVREKMLHFGDSLTELMSLAFAVLGDPRAQVTDAVVLWDDPETRTEAAHADAVVKKFQAGLLPWQLAMESMGYSPTEIERARRMRQREALEFGLGVDVGEASDLATSA